eukprot:2501969-Rhodomonas_salina.1
MALVQVPGFGAHAPGELIEDKPLRQGGTGMPRECVATSDKPSQWCGGGCPGPILPGTKVGVWLG